MFFSKEAKIRLIGSYPEEGEIRYQKLEKFAEIAKRNPGLKLIVPPELDIDLHHVLAARNESGHGLENQSLHHVEALGFGNTVGKKLYEIDHPLAKRTIKILEENEFSIDPHAIYNNPACFMTALSCSRI